MKFDDCRLPPRSAKAEALKVGDTVEALMKQEGDAVVGWQKAKIKELKVKAQFRLECYQNESLECPDFHKIVFANGSSEDFIRYTTSWNLFLSSFLFS